MVFVGKSKFIGNETAKTRGYLVGIQQDRLLFVTHGVTPAFNPRRVGRGLCVDPTTPKAGNASGIRSENFDGNAGMHVLLIPRLFEDLTKQSTDEMIVGCGPGPPAI